MINKEDIVAVYSGKPGCACGCRGTHSTSKASIARVVNKINALAPDARRIGNHYYAESETRLYIAYWTEELIFPPATDEQGQADSEQYLSHELDALTQDQWDHLMADAEREVRRPRSVLLAPHRAPKVGDALVVMMQYGEENVTVTSVDVDARGFDVVDAVGCTFWISAEDVLQFDTAK